MIKWSMCLKKKGYNSEFEAKSSGAMQELLENHNKKLAVYKCCFCNKYHLTHKTKKSILGLDKFNEG